MILDNASSMSMAINSTGYRTSSEIPFVPEVFRTSGSEPMPIDPPNTSYLTAMPEIIIKATAGPGQGEHVESRWKPLIGTPSKPPIPRNILVPDPSPTKSVLHDDSPVISTSPTPGSFIHRRRQGEYVPRPPVWKIYDLQTDFPLATNGSVDTNKTGSDSGSDIFTDRKSHCVSDKGFAVLPVAEQVEKMATIFSEIPDIFDTTIHSNKDSLIGPNALDNVSLKPKVSYCSITGLVENCTEAGLPIPFSQQSHGRRLPENHGNPNETMFRDKVWQSGSNGSRGGLAIRTNLLTLPPKDSSKLYEEEKFTLGTNQRHARENPPEPVKPQAQALRAHTSIPQIPRFSLHSTYNKIKSIKSTTSTKSTAKARLPKASGNSIMSGYLVAYLGRTAYAEGQFSSQLEPSDRDEFMVAVIYQDGWAMCIRRESGKKLTIIPNTPPKAVKWRSAEATVKLDYDDTIMYFLPVCSLTAIAEYKYYEQAKFIDLETKHYSKDGKIWPPARVASKAAQDQAVERQTIRIEEKICTAFRNRCEKQRSSFKLPADLSAFRQIPVSPSNSQESEQECSNKLSKTEIRRRDERKRNLRAKHEGNPLFHRFADLTPEQNAQATAYVANSKPGPDYGMRTPLRLEEYNAQKNANEQARQARLEQQLKEAELRANEKKPQGLETVEENQSGEDGTTELLRVASSRLKYMTPIADDDALSPVPPVAINEQHLGDETVVNSPNVPQQPTAATSANPTVVNSPEVPQGNNDVHPDDTKAKKGQGHPEKENKAFVVRNLGNRIGKRLRGMKSRLGLGRKVSPGPVAMEMGPKVKEEGFLGVAKVKPEVGVVATEGLGVRM